MARYNGHRNYNEWNISLWLNNDERLHTMLCKVVKEARTLDDAADRLATAISWAQTPDGVYYTRTGIRNAMRGMKAGQ